METQRQERSRPAQKGTQARYGKTHFRFHSFGRTHQDAKKTESRPASWKNKSLHFLDVLVALPFACAVSLLTNVTNAHPSPVISFAEGVLVPRNRGNNQSRSSKLNPEMRHSVSSSCPVRATLEATAWLFSSGVGTISMWGSWDDLMLLSLETIAQTQSSFPSTLLHSSPHQHTSFQLLASAQMLDRTLQAHDSHSLTRSVSLKHTHRCALFNKHNEIISRWLRALPTSTKAGTINHFLISEAV